MLSRPLLYDFKFQAQILARSETLELSPKYGSLFLIHYVEIFVFPSGLYAGGQEA